jgi:uncharacterized protein (TIGR03067 family)
LGVVLFLLPTARGQEPTGDLARLQGRWATFVEYPGGKKAKVIMEFKGNLVTSSMGDVRDAKVEPNVEAPDSQMEVRVNEEATPKTIDFVNGKYLKVEKGSLAEKFGVPDMMGIYELKGDTLHLAMGPFSKKRLTTFKPEPGVSVQTYTRGTEPVEEVVKPTPKTTKAGKPAARPALTGDLALLQGTWQVQSGHLNASSKETLVIEGDVLTATAKVAKGEARYSSKIALDETASPRAIDFLNPTAGSKKLPPAYGIYELNGDTLTIHKSGVGKPRANVFEVGVQQGMVSVWKRAAAGLGAAKSNGGTSATPTPRRKSTPKR